MDWWRRARAEVRLLSRVNNRRLVEPIEVEVEIWEDTEQGTSWFTARSEGFLPHGWGKTADQAVDDFADAVERYYHDLADIALRLDLPDLPELTELQARFAEADGAVPGSELPRRGRH